jgi:hypothetical protein
LIEPTRRVLNKLGNQLFQVKKNAKESRRQIFEILSRVGIAHVLKFVQVAFFVCADVSFWQKRVLKKSCKKFIAGYELCVRVAERFSSSITAA